MDGRERLLWIKWNYTALTFSFIEMFAKDLIGYHLGRGNCEISRQVCFMWTPVCGRSGGRKERKGGDAAQKCHSGPRMSKFNFFKSHLWSTVIIAIASGVWKWSRSWGRGLRLGGGKHERHKSRCGLFLLSLIGQDPLSLTFCTPSLAFHMVILARPKEETLPELSGGGQRLPLFFSASFPRYISSFLASSPLKQLDRLWHERKWVDSGWERWGWHSRCDPRVCCSDPWLCVCGVLFLSGPCNVSCGSVIVWATPLV